MKSVFLDIDSMGPDIDLTPLHAVAPAMTTYPNTAPDEVIARVADHDIVIVNKTPLRAEIFDACPQLKMIAVTATGLNNIDLPAALAAGVEVANVTHYATGSLVQHTFALMLALATRLPAYQRSVQAGEWQRSANFCLMHHPILELEGKTLGIVGYGDLGQAVARAADAFGMRVLVAERPGSTGSLSAGVPSDGPPRTPFDDVLAAADVLSLHCLLSDQTRHLISGPQLARMKPGAFLINTARGGLIDETALADALRAGRLAGAGLDVLSEEPPRSPNPLLALDHPNLIITPHCAWASREARQRLINRTAVNISEFLAAGEPD